MEKHKTILLFVISIVIICVIGITFLNMADDTDYKNNGEYKDQQKPDDEVELIEDRSAKYKQAEITQNMKPDFKVGETFEYERTGNGGNPTSGSIENAKFIFTVDGIERINKTEYYIISYVMHSSFMGKDSEGGKVVFEQFWKFKYYINAETGKFLKFDKEIQVIHNGLANPKETTEGRIIPEEQQLTYNGLGMYYLWMLYLDDNFKMETGSGFKKELEVVGMDTLNGRDCFKVEIRTIMTRNNEAKVIRIEKMWVDKKRRILLKSEDYEDNVKTSVMELVSKITEK